MSGLLPFLDSTEQNITAMASTESSSNVSLSCALKSFQDPYIVLPYSDNLVTAVRSIQAIFYVIVYLLAMLLNILVIVLMKKYRQLRTRTNLFALQIIVLNLLYTSTVYLFRPITAIADRWLFGEHLCVLSAFLFKNYTSIRFFLMVVFAIDRFLAIFFSFTYPKHSSKILLAASIFTWCASVAFRAIALPWGLDCYAHYSYFHLCAYSASCGPPCMAYGYCDLILLYAPACILPFVVFALISCKARRVRKRNDSESSVVQLLKQEWPPTVIFFLLFLSFFFLTMPRFISVITIFAVFEDPPVLLYIFAAILQIGGAFPTVVDPIVMLRDKDFKGMLLELCASLCPKKNGGESQGVQEEETSSSVI